MAEPVLVGLIFADRIITENNNKKGIIGTFNRFSSPKFPVMFPPWAVYAAVTNLTGPHKFAVNLVLDHLSQVVFASSGDFEVERLDDVVEIPLHMNGIMFPNAGAYNLTFVVDGVQVGSRVLKVDQTTQSGG